MQRYSVCSKGKASHLLKDPSSASGQCVKHGLKRPEVGLICFAPIHVFVTQVVQMSMNSASHILSIVNN